MVEELSFQLQAQQPNEMASSSRSQIEPLRDRQTNQLRLSWQKMDHIYSAVFTKLDWRMVTRDLAVDHVQETNMTLDHVYGIPYLPGSAFKGVVRSWVIQEYFGNNENLAMRDMDFIARFW